MHAHAEMKIISGLAGAYDGTEFAVPLDAYGFPPPTFDIPISTGRFDYWAQEDPFKGPGEFTSVRLRVTRRRDDGVFIYEPVGQFS